MLKIPAKKQSAIGALHACRIREWTLGMDATGSWTREILQNGRVDFRDSVIIGS